MGLTIARSSMRLAWIFEFAHSSRKRAARSGDSAVSGRPVLGMAASSPAQSSPLRMRIWNGLAPSNHFSNRCSVPSPPGSKRLPGGTMAAASASTMRRSCAERGGVRFTGFTGGGAGSGRLTAAATNVL